VDGLKASDLHKSYGETRALTGVSFSVYQGEIVGILGPSGCGKSTTLAIIAGLEQADRGQVFWNNEELSQVPPHRRGFGLMFQDYVLFPHMNVFDNVAFGLRMADQSSPAVRERVNETLELVGLPNFGTRDVNTLSGGEQQRVALARSLAPEPKLLMLDEPLGALDRTLRERLMLELREILLRMRQTAIYVTHDQEQAFAVSDRVVVMNEGRVAQVGAPQDIYSRPASTFVARFLGLENLFPAEIELVDEQLHLETPVGDLVLPEGSPGAVTVLVRPDAARLDDQGRVQKEGTVVERSFRGNTCLAVIEIDDLQMTFEFLARAPVPEQGKRIQLSFDPDDAVQILQ
jgi:ABC-type Fe3+/spermidine/putrescine transport system ATPase subunit